MNASVLPTAGELAPDFTLIDDSGTSQSLSAQHGRWVVLFFYPKDFTSGCTTEVCEFRDLTPDFEAAGASLEQALVALEMDPTSAVINSRVALAYLWLGDGANSETFFERAAKYGAGGPVHTMAYALFLYREGRSAEAYELTREAARMAGGGEDWIDPVFAALDDAQYRGEALAAVDEAVRRDGISRQIEFIVRVLLGDLDHVVFYDKPFLKFERLLETYLGFAPVGFQSFLKAMPLWLN